MLVLERKNKKREYKFSRRILCAFVRNPNIEAIKRLGFVENLLPLGFIVGKAKSV